MDLDHDACYRALRTRDARFDGRLFTGVKTTGIYCRPVCPARTPKRENVVFYPSAAAAQEAGFRPCLRCRPESAPELAIWLGTSNTVSRALSLIEHGALDEGDVEALAARVGLGERQLRRLFERHLGASPVAVAQTRRVLLAKQLLHDTTLTMSEVALAAGFGSIRRFNEVFHDLFGSAPSTLRRARARAALSTPSGRVTLLLRYRPPYDWEAMLAFLRLRAMPGVEVVSEDSYARTFALGEAQGVVRVTHDPGDALRATISVSTLAVLPELLARLRRVFDLAADPAAIGAHLAADPRLAPLVAARPGLRVPGAFEPFELAVRAVLGQQISVSAAVALAGKLVARHGALLAHEDAEPGLTHVFPTARQLAAADLSTLPMPRARSQALASLAEAVARDPRIFGQRRELAETVADLRKLPGIGEWTAQYIALRALREPDAFPAADLGLLRAMTDAAGERPTPRALLAHAERWRPWRAYAAQYLWLADPGPRSARSAA